MNNSLHVLVVEDMIVAQKIMTIHMKSQGCTVDIAADGATALQKADEIPYDIILMDIGLGEGPDGFEVAEAIKTSSVYNKNTMIMAITSHEESEFLAKGSSCGMDLLSLSRHR